MNIKYNLDLEYILNYDSLQNLYKKWKNSIDLKVYNTKHKREATPYPIFDRKREDNEKYIQLRLGRHFI